LINLNEFYFFGVFLIIIHLYYIQIKKLNISNENSCLRIFKSNNTIGLLVFISLILGKI